MGTKGRGAARGSKVGAERPYVQKLPQASAARARVRSDGRVRAGGATASASSPVGCVQPTRAGNSEAAPVSASVPLLELLAAAMCKGRPLASAVLCHDGSLAPGARARLGRRAREAPPGRAHRALDCEVSGACMLCSVACALENGGSERPTASDGLCAAACGPLTAATIPTRAQVRLRATVPATRSGDRVLQRPSLQGCQKQEALPL